MSDHSSIDTATLTDDQRRLVLTPHPLQRVGAYALAALEGRTPGELSTAEFDSAMARVADDAARASTRESKSADGFWQKVSHSFFPNAPLNHPGRRKGKNAEGEPRTDDDVRAAVRAWLLLPDPETWPDAGCALCGRQAVGWYGKRDMVLAESEAYRNTTPRGHEGTALCFPCLGSFYALPYGSQLTGGTSTALHSWQDQFLRTTVARRADANAKAAVTGRQEDTHNEVKEVVALRALRAYAQRVTAGVELVVFNNNNRGQLLETHRLDQPLAEWLRTVQRGMKPAFRTLVAAHSSQRTAGVVALSRNAFRSPTRILQTGARYQLRLMGVSGDHQDERRELAEILQSFAIKVMHVREKDMAEIRHTAERLGRLLAQEESAGLLKTLRARLREPGRLRRWLTTQGVRWACMDPEDDSTPKNRAKAELGGPLITDRAHLLLFDPSPEATPWLYRDLLLVGVLEELSKQGWHLRGDEARETESELREQIHSEDQRYHDSDENEEKQ